MPPLVTEFRYQSTCIVCNLVFCILVLIDNKENTKYEMHTVAVTALIDNFQSATDGKANIFILSNKKVSHYTRYSLNLFYFLYIKHISQFLKTSYIATSIASHL